MLATIKKAMKQVWTVDIVEDYRNKFLLKEDTLKNSVYYHLRNRLGDVFLMEHNLRIFTEYYMNGQKIDLAIVVVDVAQSEDKHLRECVTDVVIAMELKYKSAVVNKLFREDVVKVMGYLKNNEHPNGHYYLGFIQEVLYEKPENFAWLTPEEGLVAKGRVTELIQFLDPVTQRDYWDIVEH